MNSLETPTIVQAIYSFKGKNNDELNFKKGDFITITQKDEGGWWEGTLDGKTGWFPSNYVKDARGQDLKSPSGGLVVESSAEQQKAYRNLILKDIVDSEKSHVTEIQNLFRNVLTPLGSSDILSKAEFNQLSGNLSEIVDLHVRFLNTLEECQDKSGGEQRVGRVFLNTAEQMKTVHTEYCANHPKAVCILERHKDKLGTFVEGLGCSSPGLVFLTVGLSRPFRRLERYAGSLQELERHMEEFHPDRGDTQRSLFLYQNLASSCAAVRRQKQQELDVLCGSVRNWEGDEAHRLGELLYMGPVKLLTGPSEVKDRHFVLFSQCVVLLSVSQRLSAFVFERKVPLIGASLTAVEDKEGLANALEISGSSSERMLIGCPSSEERQRLIDLLHKQINCEAPISLTTSSSLPYQMLSTGAQQVTTSQPIQPQPASKSMAAPVTLNNNNLSSVLRPILRRNPHPASAIPAANPPYPPSQNFSGAAPSSVSSSGKIWTWSCLRPSPPLRPCPTPPPGIASANKKIPNKSYRKRELTYEDDLQLLQVVEAYCMTAKYRQTVKSALLECPQVLIPDEEKLIIEETTGSQTVVEEKSLVDTVYALRDQVRELQSQLMNLAKDVEMLKAKNP